MAIHQSVSILLSAPLIPWLRPQSVNRYNQSPSKNPSPPPENPTKEFRGIFYTSSPKKNDDDDKWT